jgi:hypothetical protein
MFLVKKIISLFSSSSFVIIRMQFRKRSAMCVDKAQPQRGHSSELADYSREVGAFLVHNQARWQQGIGPTNYSTEEIMSQPKYSM